MIKILHTSDSHGRNFDPPTDHFDLFIDSGDFGPNNGKNFSYSQHYTRKVNKEAEALYQKEWFDTYRLPFYRNVNAANKIVLTGNHDFMKFDKHYEDFKAFDKTGTLEIDGMRIGILAGSNIIEGGLENKWNDEIDEFQFNERIHSLPSNIDLLICHQPPYGIMDLYEDGVTRFGSNEIYISIFGRSFGAQKSYFTNLKGVFFGHIHEAHGMMEFDIEGRTVKFSNAAGQFNIIELEI